jgi:hypothetical protein
MKKKAILETQVHSVFTKAEAGDTAVVRPQDQVGMESRKWAYGHRQIEHGGLQATARGAVAGPAPRPLARSAAARSIAFPSRFPSAAGRQLRATARRRGAPRSQWPARIESESETARVRPAPSTLPASMCSPLRRAPAGRGAGAPMPRPSRSRM